MTDVIVQQLALETLRGDHDSYLVLRDRLEETDRPRFDKLEAAS